MNTAFRKSIVVSSIALSALIWLDVVNAADALLRFLAAGHIPGTNVYIDAGFMLLFWIALTGAVTGRITARLAGYFQPKAASLAK